jgi:quercetin dioxygenase-like cupin family protein
MVRARSPRQCVAMNTTPHTSPILRAAGEGERAQQAHATITVKLDAAEAQDGRVGGAEFTFPPGFGPPLHTHHAEDEIIQVLEGALRIVCGDVDATLEAGGFAYLPRGVPHTFQVQGDAPARALTLFTPGGVERLFTVAPEEFEAAAAGYEIEFVGPPLDA